MSDENEKTPLSPEEWAHAILIAALSGKGLTVQALQELREEMVRFPTLLGEIRTSLQESGSKVTSPEIEYLDSITHDL